MEPKIKFILKNSISKYLRLDTRSRVITDLVPDAILVQGDNELPLYRFDVVEQILKQKEAK